MTLPVIGVAYQSPGDLSGLTLRTQWQTAFVKKPQWIFVTGWNEHIAQVMPPQLLTTVGAVHKYLAYEDTNIACHDRRVRCCHHADQTPLRELQPQGSGGLPGGVGAASMGLELDTSFAANAFVSGL